MTKTADDDSYDAFVFLENIAGTLYVRVEDSDRTSRNQILDTLFVDHMYVLTAGGGGSAGPPAAPTGLAATAGNGQVGLDWADNTEPDLDGYNVYRATVGGGPYAQINAALVGVSDFVDNSVLNGTTYYYVVTAVNDTLNESGNSNEDSATPRAAPSAAIVDCITYTTSGGRNGDRNMIIAVSIVDDFDNGVADADVSISIEQDFGMFGWLVVSSATGPTNTSGVIQFLAKNFPNACYRSVITQIDAGVLVFDGFYPANSFCKGSDPTPDSHCR